MNAKKDFSAALRMTATQQKTIVEDRFSRADSVLLNPAAATASSVKAAPEPVAPAGESARTTVFRDTFSLPAEVHAIIDTTRQAAAREGLLLNKSDIVRDALMLLASLEPDQLMQRMRHLKRLKPGRK
jgi:hypothetical protein